MSKDMFTTYYVEIINNLGKIISYYVGTECVKNIYYILCKNN